MLQNILQFLIFFLLEYSKKKTIYQLVCFYNVFARNIGSWKVFDISIKTQTSKDLWKYLC